MKYEVPKCLECGSELEYYREVVYMNTHKINKDGRLSKRFKSQEWSDGADGLECRNCRTMYWYELDNKNRVCDIYKK